MKLFKRFNNFARDESSVSHLVVGALLIVTILYSATMM